MPSMRLDRTSGGTVSLHPLAWPTPSQLYPMARLHRQPPQSDPLLTAQAPHSG